MRYLSLAGTLTADDRRLETEEEFPRSGRRIIGESEKT
jgi:hypothetical protein